MPRRSTARCSNPWRRVPTDGSCPDLAGQGSATLPSSRCTTRSRGRGGLGVVGRHHDGGAPVGLGPQQGQHHAHGWRVELAGRLVGEQHGAPRAPGRGPPRPAAADRRRAPRRAGCPPRRAPPPPAPRRPAAAPRRRFARRGEQRHEHVLAGRSAPRPGALPWGISTTPAATARRESVDGLGARPRPRPASGRISRQHPQQGRLAGAGGPVTATISPGRTRRSTPARAVVRRSRTTTPAQVTEPSSVSGRRHRAPSSSAQRAPQRPSSSVTRSSEPGGQPLEHVRRQRDRAVGRDDGELLAAPALGADPAVADGDGARQPGGDVGVVGDDDDRGADGRG